MPLNDTKAQLWISNWLNYQVSHGNLATQWNKWIGDDARALGLQTIPISDPWTDRSSGGPIGTVSSATAPGRHWPFPGFSC